MKQGQLTILGFPDCTDWENDFLRSLEKALRVYGTVNFVRVPSGGHIDSTKIGDKVWLVAHDWKAALRQMGGRIKGKEVWASVLNLPDEKGSLFTLLWRRLISYNPSSLRLLTHSPINYRFYREMEGWRSDRLFFVPFGAITSKADTGSERQKDVSDEMCVVGAFSKLVPESNFNFLMNVAHYVVQKRPDTIFRFIGTGPLYPHLMQCVRDLGLESRVEIVETEFSTFMGSIDIYLYPSVRNDHFLSLIEAARYAIPTVAVDLPGISDFIVDGKNGFIVRQHETKAMGELVIRLIDHQSLRRALGEEFFRTTGGKYSLDSIASEYAETFWKGVLGTRSVRAA